MRANQTLAWLAMTIAFGAFAPGALDAAAQETVVPPGFADSLLVSDSTLFFHEASRCNAFEPVGNEVSPSRVGRLRSLDLASVLFQPDPQAPPRLAGPVRYLLDANPPRPSGSCNPRRLVSNLAADETYVYFVEYPATLYRVARVPTGLQGAEAVSSLGVLTGGTTSLVDGGDRLYYVAESGGQRGLFQYRKATGTFALVDTASSIQDLQWDGTYLHWLVNGVLRRFDPAIGSVTTLASGVTGYFPQRAGQICTEILCFTQHVAYLAFGRSIRAYDQVRGQLAASDLYLSPDPDGRVLELTTDGVHLFFFERRPDLDEPSLARRYLLYRLRKDASPGTPADLIYGPVIEAGPPDSLTTQGFYLFWRSFDSQAAYRLPTDAAVLPQTNLVAIDLDVFQSLRPEGAYGLLLEGKRTFVALRARAEGARVRDVPARLHVTYNLVTGGTRTIVLEPINQVGGQPLKRLTVGTSTPRASLQQNFLFELPRYVIEVPNLSPRPVRVIDFRAEVNPFRAPNELAGYGDNVVTLGDVTLHPSPRLAVDFVRFGYPLFGGNGQPIRARDGTPLSCDPRAQGRLASSCFATTQERQASEEWMRAMYALASPPGGVGDPSPGLRTRESLIVDEELARRTAVGGSGADGNPFGYVNQRLYDETWKHGTYPCGEHVVYGLVPHWVTASSSCCGDGERIASGPSYDVANYPAHEIGHLTFLPHPPAIASRGCSQGSGPEGAGYPYPDNRLDYDALVDDDETFGVSIYGGALALLDPDSYVDIMSYCQPGWVSDYHYRRQYAYMMIQPYPTPCDDHSWKRGARGAAGSRAPIPGDWLVVTGEIDVASDRASLGLVSRSDRVAVAPPLPDVAGPYRIELADAAGSVLVDFPFTPDAEVERANLLRIAEVVPFHPGTREIRVVAASPDRVIGVRAVSAASPTGATASVDLAGAGNLARSPSASVRQSSTVEAPERAVDGNADGHAVAAQSVSETDVDLHAFWEVDLGAPRRVDTLRVWLRQDQEVSRNRFAVLVATQPFQEADFAGQELPDTYANQAVEIHRSPAGGDRGPLELPVGRTVRYVRIAHLLTAALSLAEVEALGSAEVAWSASDADGDPLHFDVYHLADDGARTPLAFGLTGPSARLATEGWPSGSGRLEVVARDGVLEARAQTPAFVLPPSPPRPTILSPESGTRVQWGQLLALEGEALQAGNLLPEGSLSWRVGARELGTGSLLTVEDLDVGTRFVTLVATDALGQSASQTIDLAVEDDLEPSAPVLAAAPDRVGWNLAVGDVAPREAAASIANVGGGSLRFSAVSDAPWLAVDPVSGSAPGSLRLTARPEGLGWGRTHRARVVITSPDDPGREAAIEVELTIGDVRTESDGDGIADAGDNCRLDANPDQRDSDRDGFGNLCDPDLDGNGVVGLSDFNALRRAFGSRVGDARYDPAADFGGDGVIGLADFNALRRRFGAPPGPSGLVCAGTAPCPPGALASAAP